jgi:hypothetical protein
MIVTVRDPGILSNLDPAQLTAYLQAQGWYLESQVDNKESVWVKTTQTGVELGITLPLNPSIRAYALRMSEILEILEKAEGRSQLDILSNLVTRLPNAEVQGVVVKLDLGHHDVGSAAPRKSKVKSQKSKVLTTKVFACFK